MLLHPQQSAKTKLTNTQEGDYQPNAVDIRLDKIWLLPLKYMITSDRDLPAEVIEHTEVENIFTINDDEKFHAARFEILPDQDGYFILQPGSYEICFENQINVAQGEVGWVITRSTLNRNGCFITSGLYDSGYHGPMAGALHVSIPTKIKKGTRIGQYLIMKSESVGEYNGDYGFDENGKLKDMNNHLGC